MHAAFANAGTGLDTPGTENGDPEEWHKLIDLNIMALLYTARASLPELRKTRGHLVLTGSVAGKVHIPGSIYAPGMVDTPFFSEPKPDKLQAEDVAAAVMFALQQPERANVPELTVMPTG